MGEVGGHALFSRSVRVIASQPLYRTVSPSGSVNKPRQACSTRVVLPSDQRVQRAERVGARDSFWVKNSRPNEEPGTLTRRSKDPRPLRLGVAVSMGTDAERYIGQVAYILPLMPPEVGLSTGTRFLRISCRLILEIPLTNI
jgi:hypothetical protein